MESSVSIINEYLPQALSEEEVKSLVKDSVEESGAQSIADLGKIMPIIMKKGAGRVNGKLAQQILREILFLGLISKILECGCSNGLRCPLANNKTFLFISNF